MRPEEIMIGDYVNFLIDIEGGDTDYDPKVAQYQPMKIVSLSSWYNNDGEVESAEGIINYIDQVEPIPLTPEILEKNGFELQRDKSELGTLDTYWLGSEIGAFRIHKLNNGDYQFGLAKIKFVHQLQHAIRLCGISKNIEI